MVAKADDPERVELALRSIGRMLDELPGLVSEWGTMTRDEQLAWSLDWGNEMVKLDQLTGAEATGQLAGRQGQQLRRLAERIVAALGLMSKLDLRCPSERVLVAGRVQVEG